MTKKSKPLLGKKDDLEKLDVSQLPVKKASKSSLEEKKQDAVRTIEFEPGKYTPELIQQWKELGLAKPEWVPWTDWNKGEDLTPKQGVVCHLSAMAMTHEEISRITGLSVNYISGIVSSELGKEEVQRIQDKVWGDDFKKIINKIVPLAIQTAVQAMLDPNTKAQTKVDAAFRFMDRSMGRPVQQLEIRDNLIRSVFEKLDSQRPVVHVDSKPEVPVLTQDTPVVTVKQTLDPIDEWVKENL